MPGGHRRGHVEANQVDKGSQADLAVGLDSADGRIENPPRSPRLDTFRRTYRVPRHPNDVIRPAITPDVPRVAWTTTSKPSISPFGPETPDARNATSHGPW